ncbi:MAG TPA: hypothetical protein VHV51_06795 [Polyangiaceae bacterium]|jgi:hypothetical protein|nr:hypothetical protein [Polyangiaceae bacterium]
MRFGHDPGSLPLTNSSAPGGFVVERPPVGLARGKYPASPWVIGALGAALVLAAIVYFLLRLRKPRS